MFHIILGNMKEMNMSWTFLEDVGELKVILPNIQLSLLAF